MKSLYIFCEFGVAISTIDKLQENNLTFLDLVTNPDCLNKIFSGEKSLKKKEIIDSIAAVQNVQYDLSIYDLTRYGLSKTIAQALHEKDIKISELIDSNLNIDEFKKVNKIGDVTFSKIIESTTRLLNERCNGNNKNQDLTIDFDQEKLFLIIKKNYGNTLFTFDDVFNDIKYLGLDVNRIKILFNQLLLSNKIELDKFGNYRLPLPALESELEKIKVRHREMVIAKLNGQTLESIGQERGITKERVRQIVSNSLRKIGYTKEEDLYKNIFEAYNFKVDIFCKLFGVKKIVYYFLKEKYKLGESSVINLLETDILDEYQKNVLRDTCNIIIYNGENVIFEKVNLLEIILKYENGKIGIEDLIKKYNEFLINNSLEDKLEQITMDDLHKVEAQLSRSNKVIVSLKRMYRYYNLSDLTEEEKGSLAELLDIDSGSYSTELFYKDNPILMRELDIKDEYELHNILKTLFIGKENITFGRMPDILINCNDKLQFIKDKIIEFSPIEIDEFCQIIYDNYGHKIPTFKSLILTNFSNYISKNILMVEAPKFSDTQKSIIKQYLTKDIYSISTIKHLLVELFNVEDFQLINNINLKEIGYKTRGNYIMNSNIISLENYLKNKILSMDYYTIEEELKKIGSTYSSYLAKLIYNMDIFKVEDSKYITITKLTSIGITKDDIRKLQRKIQDFILDDTYFNLYSLEKEISFNKWRNYGLTDKFFESIIGILPDIKVIRIDNNRLFIKCENDVTREKFISSIIERFKKISISEINEYLFDTYNIRLLESDLRQYINREKYYLDSKTDFVYLNKEKYDEEVFNLGGI